MKKLLAAMLAVAMIVSMSCVAFAADDELADNAPFEPGIMVLDDAVLNGNTVTVNALCNPFKVLGACGTCVVTFDPNQLTYVSSNPNIAGTYNFAGMTGLGNAANAGKGRLIFAYMGTGPAADDQTVLPLVNAETVTAITFTFELKEGVDPADVSIDLYNGWDTDISNSVKESTATIKSSTPATETPATETPATETPATDEPATSESPAATDEPATPAGTTTPATPGSTGSTTPGTTGGATGGTTGGATGGSTGASSTTAAKTADTAPIVTMAVLALAAGTVVVAMRKRVNG